MPPKGSTALPNTTPPSGDQAVTQVGDIYTQTLKFPK